MSSSESIVIWILSFLVFALIMYISYKISYKLGIKKALYRTTYVLICVIFAFVLAPLVNNFLMEFDLTKINLSLNYKSKSFTTIIDYIEEIIAHSSFLNDLYVYFPSLKDLFMDFPQIIFVPFTYVALFIAFLIVFLPLYLYLSYRRKRRILYDRGDKIHYRVWSGVLGCVQVVFIISVVLSPLNGISRIYKTSTSDTLSSKDSSLCDENKSLKKYERYCNIISAYNSTIFSTIGGKDSVSEYIFDSLTRISYADSYTSFSDETAMIIKSGIVLNQSKLLDMVLGEEDSIPLELVVNNTLSDNDIDIIVDTLNDSKYSEDLLIELEILVTNTLNSLMNVILGVDNFEMNYSFSEEERINEIKVVLKAISSFGNTTLLNDLINVKDKVVYFADEFPENRKTEKAVFSFLVDISNSINLDEVETFFEYLFESKIFNSLVPYALDEWLNCIGFLFVPTEGDVLDAFYSGMDLLRILKKYQPTGAIELFNLLTDEEYILVAEVIEYMINSKECVNVVKTILSVIFQELNINYHIGEILSVKNWTKEIPFIKKLMKILVKVESKKKIKLSEFLDVIDTENSELAGIFKNIVRENTSIFLQLIIEG